MTFEHPDLLLLGPASALLLAAALAWQWRRLGRLGRTYGAVASLRLVPRGVQRFPTGRMFCLILVGFALSGAAAEPRLATPEPADPPRSLDIAVVVDISRSMGATDVQPSRIGRARLVVDRLTEALPSARIVLVVFADWPYTLVPPTDDPAVVQYFARSLSADLVSDRDQGTSLAAALAHARASLATRPREGARKAVLVLSDGGMHEDPAAVGSAAAEAARGGAAVWTAGLGTGEGSTLMTESGPLLDDGGRAVVSALDDGALRAVAYAGGGAYHDVTSDAGLRSLLADLSDVDGVSQHRDGAPLDAAFWLTLSTLPLLLLEGGLDAGRRVRGSPRFQWDA